MNEIYCHMHSEMTLSIKNHEKLHQHIDFLPCVWGWSSQPVFIMRPSTKHLGLTFELLFSISWIIQIIYSPHCQQCSSERYQCFCMFYPTFYAQSIHYCWPFFKAYCSFYSWFKTYFKRLKPSLTGENLLLHFSELMQVKTIRSKAFQVSASKC